MASGKLSLSEWKEKSQEEQKYKSTLLSGRIWDKFIKGKDDKDLFKKIAFPLFGDPKEDSEDFGLNDAQKQLVDDIKEKCFKHNMDFDNICIAVIFVYVRVNNGLQTFVPLIRVMKHYSRELEDIPNNIFIDHMGRVYESWWKYLEDNTWDMSWLCVPKNGYYSSEHGIEFIDQSSKGEVIQRLDNGITAGGIASSVFLAAGTVLTFFPPTSIIGVGMTIGATITGVPIAGYGVVRSVTSLVDRNDHEQSISLTDPEARMHWLSILTGALSAGTLGAARVLQSIAKTGNLVSSATRVSVTALNATSVSVSGVTVLLSLKDFFEKKDRTALDYLQLSTTIFFFTHSVISFKTASAIIKDAQNDVIMEMRKNVKAERRPVYDALMQGAKENVEKGKVKNMHGNAVFIKEMKKINNLNDFYSHFGYLPDGQIKINDELTMHPRAYTQMSEAQRDKVLKLSKALEQNEINLSDFNKEISSIQKEYRFRTDRQRAKGIEYLKEKFNVGDVSDIEIGGNRLGNIKPEVLDRLENVVRNSFQDRPEMIKIANKFSEKVGVKNVTEYCAVGEYVVRKVEAEVKSLQQKNPNPTRERGVKIKDHYKSLVVKELLEDGDKMNHLVDDFNNLRIRCDAANVGSPKFGNSMAAANHYDKHPLFPKIDPHNNLSPERYFEIATEMAGGPITDIKWTQDGSSLCCTFTSEKYGATSIKYHNLANKTSVIATLFANKSEKQFTLIK